MRREGGIEKKKGAQLNQYISASPEARGEWSVIQWGP